MGESAQKRGHGADTVQALQDALAAGDSLPDLFMTVGTEDPLLQNNREFHEILKKQGIEHIYEEHSGGHTWEYWDGHLPEVLDWLQGKGKYAKAPELAEEV